MRRLGMTLVGSAVLGLGIAGFLYFGPLASPRKATRIHDVELPQRRLSFGDKNANRPMLMVQPGFALPVWSMVLSNDGKWLIEASRDRFAHVWNLTEGKEVTGFESDIGAIRSVALSADGRWLAGTDEHLAHLWDFATGAKVGTFKGHNETVESVAISADGSRLATCGRDGVRVWDKSDESKPRHFFPPRGFRMRAVALSPDGRWVITAGDDRMAHLWSADTGEEIRSFSGHTDPVRAVAIGSDGKQLFTASDDETACLWDLTTGSLIRSFFASGRVIGLCTSQDGKRLATGSEDRLAVLWDVATGKEIQAFRGHAAAVRTLALTADGRRLFTGGNGEGDPMRLWDVATGLELCRIVSFKIHIAESERGWAVIDSENQFDAANDGKVGGLSWMVGGRWFPLDKFKDSYVPGLLAKHLRGN